MPQPEFDPVRRNILGQARKAAQQMVFQNFRALPIGGSVNACNLHLARTTQAARGTHDGHFAIGWHQPIARCHFRRADFSVIAAFALEWHIIPGSPRQRLGMHPGGNYGGIAGDLPLPCRHGA